MLLIALLRWEDYLNYPGLELWKFVDLGIFVTVAIVILRKPVSAALVARGESIRQELLKARAERESAEQKLSEADALLQSASSDTEKIKEQARQEADAERQRLATAAEQEIERMKAQAARELEIARKAARNELQEFLAGRSIEIARRKVISELRPDDDARLIGERIGELGRARG